MRYIVLSRHCEALPCLMGGCILLIAYIFHSEQKNMHLLTLFIFFFLALILHFQRCVFNFTDAQAVLTSFMLLSYLVLTPIIGSVLVASVDSYKNKKILYIKKIALSTSVLNLIISLIVFILFHNSSNQFQFVQEHYNIQNYDLFLGVDGISIYFILLTTIIMPIALLSN